MDLSNLKAVSPDRDKTTHGELEDIALGRIALHVGDTDQRVPIELLTDSAMVGVKATDSRVHARILGQTAGATQEDGKCGGSSRMRYGVDQGHKGNHTGLHKTEAHADAA